MNFLIVYAHPNPGSFNRAIVETLSTALRDGGHDVRVRDLYGLAFDPVMSLKDLRKEGEAPAPVRTEREHVSWANVLIFVYPVWFNGMPAIAKGYFDRVFCEGFGYELGPGGARALLTGKKAFVIQTLGAPAEVYESTGLFKAMEQVLQGGMFSISGIESLGTKSLCSVYEAGDAGRKAMLEEVRALAATLR
jgi:NAD(P)H dehydrogenase (quinone)